MDLNSIRDALKRQPFRPFTMCLADGRTVPVKHPEFVAITSRIVVVAGEDSSVAILEPLLIVSLEHSGDSAGKANGKGRGRGKGK
jgi:hypothetical protein